MATTSDGRNWQTKHGEAYLVEDRHRNGGWRSRWSVSPAKEVEIFESACDQNWADSTVRWGLHLISGAAYELGTRGELISKHPRSAANVPWHGYPAQPSPSHPTDIPPDQLLNSWCTTGFVRFNLVKRIHRGTWSPK